jgi:tRNA 2-selenouridine synthase
VARNIAAHLDTLFADKPRDWKPLVYCWRGGNRSGSMAHILAKVGWPASSSMAATRPSAARQRRAGESAGAGVRVVCGTTGSGKSRLLETLDAIGAQVLDLERLAAHRGSVLGTCRRAAAQPEDVRDPHLGQAAPLRSARRCSSNRKARRSATCACRTR